MKVTKAELAAAAANQGQFPREPLPQIALVGRSNVGKSSVINALLNRKNLARTSSVPGRTQLVFFYKVNDAFYLVDLPGYGYARAGKELWARVRARADGYFHQAREKLKVTLVIIDAKTGVSPLDREMVTYLFSQGLGFHLVLNKTDQASQGELHRAVREAEKLSRENNAGEIILFSAKSGQGKDQLWGKLRDLFAL